MKQFIKKPVIIEAVQWNGSNKKEVLSFYKNAQFIEDKVVINTLEGEMTASKDDYIIKGVKGEFYPCKPDIFEATYDEFITELSGASFIEPIK